MAVKTFGKKQEKWLIRMTNDVQLKHTFKFNISIYSKQLTLNVIENESNL